MANTFSPFGFRPIMRRDGAAWAGNQTLRRIVSTSTSAIYYGDLVSVLSTGYVTNGTVGGSSHLALGIFVGCRYVPTAFGYMRWSNYWPGGGNITAAGDIDCYVIDDREVVLEVQSTGTAGITIADVGINCDFVSSAGSQVTGQSLQSINANSIATTSTFPFRVWAVPSAANTGSVPLSVSANFDAGSANNVIQVCWNDQFYNQTTGV